MSGSEERGSGARPGAGAGRKSGNQPGNSSRRNGPQDRNGSRGGHNPRGGGKGNFPKRDSKHGAGKPGGDKHGAAQGRHKDRPQKDRPQKDAGGSHEGATNKSRPVEPTLPADIDPEELQTEIRRELRPLPKHVADNVAAHLVATGYLLDSDPEQALEHARYARKRAARIPSVREANGVAAYNAAQWNEALNELRTARRLSGGAGHVAMMADAERAMGRPERAIELSRSQEAAQLDRGAAIELHIVVSGARRDLGEVGAAVVGLQLPELDPQRQDPWSARLFYAYADNLLAAGRVQEAFTWFVHAAHADDEEDTDATERLDELVHELGGPEKADELVHQAVTGSAAEPAESTRADEPDSAEEPQDPTETSGEGQE